MATPPSPLNPFLGSQTVPTPQPGGAPTSAEQNVTSSPAIQTMAEDLPAEGAIATPKSRWRHRAVWRGVIALALVGMIAGSVYWWFRDAGMSGVTEETIPKAKPSGEATTVPRITPDDGALALPQEDANYASENFKAGEIVIGGELQFLVDEDEVGALTVENIRGEAFTEKNKQEVKLVVTWTTNKLALASVGYSKGIGQTERAVDETDYSYNHSVIISGLDPASTYLYTIDASDRYGNRVKSEPHAVFTGARSVSLFDLIAGAIGEVFGWAVTDK